MGKLHGFFSFFSLQLRSVNQGPVECSLAAFGWTLGASSVAASFSSNGNVRDSAASMEGDNHARAITEEE